MSASDWWSGDYGFDPHQVRQHPFMERDHEIISMVILSLPLTSFSLFHWLKKGSCQFLVKKFPQVLVNCLEGKVCPGKVLLGKLTGLTWLNSTYIDWVIKLQTN